MGLFMTVDRLIHEWGNIKQGEKVFVKGRGFLIFDPVKSNDYWWHKKEKSQVPDIPQMLLE